MARIDECPILSMENIDHIICNVVFESLVLNVYGNFLSILFTSPFKFVTFSYLHVDVIDNMGTTTITSTLKEVRSKHMLSS